MARPADLPDFDAPPIDEVAVSVQLASPIAGFVDAHAGLFWETIKDRYPRAESHHRADSFPENLAVQAGPPAPMFISAPIPGARTFLISDNDAFLLQIQNTRFARNWRHRDGAYPHFDALGDDFRKDFAAFQAFLSRESMALPTVTQLEINYINWITRLEPHEFLRPGTQSGLSLDGLSEWPQDQNWSARYLVSHDDGQAYARLTIQAVTALRAVDGESVRGSQMSLLFSVPQPDLSDEGLTALLAKARGTIVHAFTQATTEEGHKLWRRKQ